MPSGTGLLRQAVPAVWVPAALAVGLAIPAVRGVNVESRRKKARRSGLFSGGGMPQGLVPVGKGQAACGFSAVCATGAAAAGAAATLAGCSSFLGCRRLGRGSGSSLGYLLFTDSAGVAVEAFLLAALSSLPSSPPGSIFTKHVDCAWAAKAATAFASRWAAPRISPRAGSAPSSRICRCARYSMISGNASGAGRANVKPLRSLYRPNSLWLNPQWLFLPTHDLYQAKIPMGSELAISILEPIIISGKFSIP